MIMHENSHNLSVSEQKHSQKSPFSSEVDRQILTSPRYGEVDRQICIFYFRRADMPSLMLSLYYDAFQDKKKGIYNHDIVFVMTGRVISNRSGVAAP